MACGGGFRRSLHLALWEILPQWGRDSDFEKESRSKLDKDKVKPYDYTYQNSLYETFKPPSKTYLDQLEHAKTVRKTMWRKTFNRTKPNIAKNVSFLPVSKSISKSRQVYNEMTNNFNHFRTICEQAWSNHTNSAFPNPTAKSMEVLIKTLLMPLSNKTILDSHCFVHELKTEMHDDLEYVKSLEKEIDELESEKADFSNIYDLLLEECVSKDVICSYLHSLSDLNAYTELQCLYLHKVKECECLAKSIVQLILFIVDSGCTKHMTGNLKLLCNFVEKFLGTVRFGNDQFAPILGYGDLIQGNVTIKRVYYVEGLNHNLFSVGQFCDADLELIQLKGDGYAAKELSHINFDYNLLTLLERYCEQALPKLKICKGTILFRSCEMGKAKRSSFKTKAVLSSKGRLNLLHMDLCGPMRVARIIGKKQNVVPTAKTDSSQQGLEFLFSPLLEEYYNPTHGHTEDNNNDQAPNASFQEDEFINPFCTRVQEIGESSSRNIDNTDVHSFQPQSHDYRWDQRDPLKQVPWKSLPCQFKTRRLLYHRSKCGMFMLTVSIVETKDIKEAMDSGFELKHFQDAESCQIIDTGKKTCGGIQFLGDKISKLDAKEQYCTAMSSAEAVYVALSASCASSNVVRRHSIKIMASKLQTKIRCIATFSHKVVRLGINPMIQPEPEDLPKDNPKLEIAVLSIEGVEKKKKNGKKGKEQEKKTRTVGETAKDYKVISLESQMINLESQEIHIESHVISLESHVLRNIEDGSVALDKGHNTSRPEKIKKQIWGKNLTIERLTNEANFLVDDTLFLLSKDEGKMGTYVENLKKLLDEVKSDMPNPPSRDTGDVIGGIFSITKPDQIGVQNPTKAVNKRRTFEERRTFK
ncbi:hypothetical protein Tco_0155447 [Tanacetum coccineum]